MVFIHTSDYHIRKAYVLSNERRVFTEDGITYIPVYYIMFFGTQTQGDLILE